MAPCHYWSHAATVLHAITLPQNREGVGSQLPSLTPHSCHIFTAYLPTLIRSHTARDLASCPLLPSLPHQFKCGVELTFTLATFPLLPFSPSSTSGLEHPPTHELSFSGHLRLPFPFRRSGESLSPRIDAPSPQYPLPPCAHLLSSSSSQGHRCRPVFFLSDAEPVEPPRFITMHQPLG